MQGIPGEAEAIAKEEGRPAEEVTAPLAFLWAVTFTWTELQLRGMAVLPPNYVDAGLALLRSGHPALTPEKSAVLRRTLLLTALPFRRAASC